MKIIIAILSWSVVVMVFAPRVLRWGGVKLVDLEDTLTRHLENFHVFLRSGAIRAIAMAVAAVATGLAVIIFDRLILAPVLLLVAIATFVVVVRLRLKKRLREIRYQLPDVIELIATSLKAGSSIRAAILQVARQSPRPISRELGILERSQRIGVPLDTALEQWSKRLGIEEVGLLSFTISVSSASGGNLSESLDRLAATFRQRLMLEEKVDALTAQGRLQSWVMIALPVMLAIVLAVMDFESMAPLWRTDVGLVVLATVVTLEILGFAWIRRLIRMED